MFNIVYYSKNGYTKEYAEMLAKEFDVKAVPIKNAKKELEKNEKIIYMASINNNKLNGLKDAEKHFDIQVICAVGMSFYRPTLPELIKVVNMLEEIPVFYLQGGFNIANLNFIEKMMIQVAMAPYSGRNDLTAEEMNMLNMLRTPANYVSFDNLKRVIAYLNGEELPEEELTETVQEELPSVTDETIEEEKDENNL